MRWFPGVTSLGLAVAMIGTWATAHKDAALALAGLFVVISLLWELSERYRRRDEVVPEISPEQADELRAELARAGEAVKRLRGLPPGLSLSAAARVIRGLRASK